VRFVVHHDLPRSIEAYYQETGRAGRDGLDSECLLLYSAGDARKIRYFIDQKSDGHEKRIAVQQLNEMIQYAESRCCRRIPLISYFGEVYSEEYAAGVTIVSNPPSVIRMQHPVPDSFWNVSEPPGSVSAQRTSLTCCGALRQRRCLSSGMTN
jgi:superfamily II DNA helicase RecQ